MRFHFQERCRSEEHTSELQSLTNLVCRLLLEKKSSSARRAITVKMVVPTSGNLLSKCMVQPVNDWRPPAREGTASPCFRSSRFFLRIRLPQALTLFPHPARFN